MPSNRQSKGRLSLHGQRDAASSGKFTLVRKVKNRAPHSDEALSVAPLSNKSTSNDNDGNQTAHTRNQLNASQTIAPSIVPNRLHSTTNINNIFHKHTISDVISQTKRLQQSTEAIKPAALLNTNVSSLTSNQVTNINHLVESAKNADQTLNLSTNNTQIYRRLNQIVGNKLNSQNVKEDNTYHSTDNISMPQSSTDIFNTLNNSIQNNSSMLTPTNIVNKYTNIHKLMVRPSSHVKSQFNPDLKVVTPLHGPNSNNHLINNTTESASKTTINQTINNPLNNTSIPTNNLPATQYEVTAEGQRRYKGFRH
jgi:hypothetical protein